MKHTHTLRLSNRFWIALFSAAVLLCVVFIILSRQFGSHTAVISKNGTEIARINLSRVTESYTIPMDGNVILVEPGSIRMQSADCPDQICVHQGVLHDTGRIVCLPNRVLIEMVHTKDAPDAKAG
ncbi:MAG: NusG domain II-containing protein [Clostridia bacterium]|nr:NusG domain II-containing protein [Clostridia bacterium]